MSTTRNKLRVWLFVEGAAPSPNSKFKPLEEIWNSHFPSFLKFDKFERIVPISKKHIVALDPNKPKMSGAGESLVQLMKRLNMTSQCDAAVVAWDLSPPWNPEGAFCRREEVLQFYELLSQSADLPQLWRDRAAARHQEVQKKAAASQARRPIRLRAGEVLALCMEPMFEDLLVRDEAALKDAMTIKGLTIKNWPTFSKLSRNPDRELLSPAIEALRGHRPQLPLTSKMIRGGLRTHKNEWGEYLLRELIRINPALIQSHEIAARLIKWLSLGGKK